MNNEAKQPVVAHRGTQSVGTDDLIPPKETKETKDPRDATIKKLQQSNDSLREELKALNTRLNELVEKQRPKRQDGVPQKEQPAGSTETERLQKELDNAHQQIKSMQRDLASLKNKLATSTTLDKITALENALYEKDKRYSELQDTNKTLEKIRKDHEKTIENLESDKEFLDKINRLIEDNRALREQLRDNQEKSMQKEKNYKKQQEFLVTLETRYRELCTKHGVSPSLNWSKAEEANAAAVHKTPKAEPGKKVTLPDDRNSRSLQGFKVRGPPRAKEEGKEDTQSGSRILEMSPENFQKLKDELDIVGTSKKTTERKLKGENAQLQGKITQLEADLTTINKQLHEKEKECNILQARYNELKRKAAAKPLAPLRESIDTTNGTGPEGGSLKKGDHSRKVSQLEESKLAESDGAGRKDQQGLSKSDMTFEDGKLFNGTAACKVSKMTVYYQNDFIYGLQIGYIKGTGEAIEGEYHVATSRKEKYLVKTLTIDPDDFITSISGVYSKAIQSLSIETAKGNKHVIGNTTKASGSKEFKLAIGDGEHPKFIYGGLSRFQDHDKEDYVLTSIGADIERYVATDFQHLRK